MHCKQIKTFDEIIRMYWVQILLFQKIEVFIRYKISIFYNTHQRDKIKIFSNQCYTFHFSIPRYNDWKQNPLHCLLVSWLRNFNINFNKTLTGHIRISQIYQIGWLNAVLKRDPCVLIVFSLCQSPLEKDVYAPLALTGLVNSLCDPHKWTYLTSYLQVPEPIFQKASIFLELLDLFRLLFDFLTKFLIEVASFDQLLVDFTIAVGQTICLSLNPLCNEGKVSFL